MARKQWFKLWQDKVRASPKWGRLKAAPRGFYLQCMLFCSPEGRLEIRSGRPITDSELREEVNARQLRDVRAWIEKLVSVGFMHRDGETLVLTNFDESQRKPSRVALGSGSGSARVAVGSSSGSSGRGKTRGYGGETPQEEKRRDPLIPRERLKRLAAQDAEWISTLEKMAAGGGNGAGYARRMLEALGSEGADHE